MIGKDLRKGAIFRFETKRKNLFHIWFYFCPIAVLRQFGNDQNVFTTPVFPINRYKAITLPRRLFDVNWISKIKL